MALSLSGKVAYHSRDELLDRPLDSDDTCVKTMFCMCGTATTNLNNLIGVAHLKESPTETAETVC